MTAKPKKRKLKKAIVLPIPPRSHQPSKKELEETMDMPAMSKKELRNTFMRPFRVAEKR